MAEALWIWAASRLFSLRVVVPVDAGVLIPIRAPHQPLPIISNLDAWNGSEPFRDSKLFLVAAVEQSQETALVLHDPMPSERVPHRPGAAPAEDAGPQMPTAKGRLGERFRARLVDRCYELVGSHTRGLSTK